MEFDPRFSPSALKQARADLGLAQEGLARALDVSLAAVQKWESGDREPSGPFVARLARLTGCQMESFYTHQREVTALAETSAEVQEKDQSRAHSGDRDRAGLTQGA